MMGLGDQPASSPLSVWQLDQLTLSRRAIFSVSRSSLALKRLSNCRLPALGQMVILDQRASPERAHLLIGRRRIRQVLYWSVWRLGAQSLALAFPIVLKKALKPPAFADRLRDLNEAVRSVRGATAGDPIVNAAMAARQLCLRVGVFALLPGGTQ